MSKEDNTPNLAGGFTMAGAITDAHNPPKPKSNDETPVRHRDSRYPARMEQSLSESFVRAKEFHSPNFVVSPSGFVSPIQEGGIGPFSTEKNGMEFKGGSGGHNFNGGKSFHRTVSSTRVMDENLNQGKRTVYENKHRQVIDPFTGMTSMIKGHFPHNK